MVALLGLAAWIGACSDPTASGRQGDVLGTGGSQGTGGTGTVVGPDGGIIVGGAFGQGGDATGGSNGGITDLTLIVKGESTEIVVSGSSVTVGFTAEYDDGSVPNSVVWLVDDTRIGSIGEDGVFRANGSVGGVVKVTARVGSQEASVELLVTVSVTANPGAVSDADQALLRAGGTGGTAGIGPDGTFAVLYPYDRTVFPRGLPSPVWQMKGASPVSLYVKVTVGAFYTYEAFSAAGTPPRFRLPEDVWKGATLSTTAQDWLIVDITELAGGVATGPIRQAYRIAQGSVTGMVYYNTYQSPLANNEGAVMRMRLNGKAEVVVAKCNVCHTVSSQGNVLAAGEGWGDGGNPVDSVTYDLSVDGKATVRNRSTDGLKYTFAALTPDGSRAIVNGVPTYEPRGVAPDRKSSLVDTKTGEVIAVTGLDRQYLRMASFAHDGSRVAFNDYAASQAGNVIAVYDFDGTQTPPVFSNRRSVVTSTQAAGWPVFLPDGNGIIYHDGDTFDTVKWTAKDSQAPTYATIKLVDMANKNQVSALSAANGLNADGTYHLPYGAAEEANMNYEPTVLPVPVGGFYWVMFTSRRAYGNTIAPGGTVAGGEYKWGSPATNDDTPSARKKIWIAAIDIDYTGKADPSHPAFYLDGQEVNSGNMRSFAALEPCRPSGASCESGAECCDGFCRETGRAEDGTPILQCVPPPENTCSNIDETCATAADCCVSTYLCINGRCALPPTEPPPPPPIR
jgi:hypothetical protein